VGTWRKKVRGETPAAVAISSVVAAFDEQPESRPPDVGPDLCALPISQRLSRHRKHPIPPST
jgi:hypothetical protein